jgi:hypothetical protein
LSEEAQRRYAWINLPHARTVLHRIDRSLEVVGAYGEAGNGSASLLRHVMADLEARLRGYAEDPPPQEAIPAADAAAEAGRRLVSAIERTRCRSDRLGQNIRNLFECLGLRAEGLQLSLRCGERPDSPLR